jgi:ABC-type transport system involved in multi-copper enzyme maturation permease subunit
MKYVAVLFAIFAVLMCLSGLIALVFSVNTDPIRVVAVTISITITGVVLGLIAIVFAILAKKE